VYFKLRRQEKRRRTSKINPEQGNSDDDISGAGKKKKRVTISSIPLSIVFNSATNKGSSMADDTSDPSNDKVALRRTSSSSEPEQISSQLEEVNLNVQPSSPSSHSTTTTSNDENESTKI